MKSGAFTLYLITGILGYAHKIPIVGRLITLASLWYGKTTIWKILVKLRKVFIIFNAIIGAYLVFKTTGFSSDNILVGFVNMGHTYIEMLLNFTKRLFHWFVELFDHKVVPNVPGDIPSTPKIKSPFWNPEPMQKVWNNKLYDFSNVNKDWFRLPININVESTPWYKDWNTLLWIAGGIVTVGTLYLGYKVIMDPSILSDWFKSNPKISTTDATPPANTGIELKDTRTPSVPGPSSATPSTGAGTAAVDTASSSIKDFSKGIGNLYHKTLYNLNPINWISSSREIQDQFNVFMDQQRNLNSARREFFPFTENNPYDSWFKKFRVRWLGETGSEHNYRLELRKLALRELDEVWGKGKNVVPGSPLPSVPTSPLTTTVGLRSGALDSWANSPVGTSKLSPISLPRTIHNLPPIDPSVTTDWNNHEVDKTLDPREALRKWREKKTSEYWRSVNPPSYDEGLDEVGVDTISSYNKYEVLDEEFI